MLNVTLKFYLVWVIWILIPTVLETLLKASFKITEGTILSFVVSIFSFVQYFFLILSIDKLISIILFCIVLIKVFRNYYTYHLNWIFASTLLSILFAVSNFMVAFLILINKGIIAFPAQGFSFWLLSMLRVVSLGFAELTPKIQITKLFYTNLLVSIVICILIFIINYEMFKKQKK